MVGLLLPKLPTLVGGSLRNWATSIEPFFDVYIVWRQPDLVLKLPTQPAGNMQAFAIGVHLATSMSVPHWNVCSFQPLLDCVIPPVSEH